MRLSKLLRSSYRSGWSRLGIVLVLVFLGHDLLMAVGDVGGAGNHALVVHAAPRFGGDGTRVMAASQHPADCGVGQQARPRLIDVLNGERGEAGTSLVCTAPTLAAIGAWPRDDWTWFGAQPGRRRALLQVFRL